MKYFLKFFVVGFVIGISAVVMLAGCSPSWWVDADTGIGDDSHGMGGGQDMVIAHLPFAHGYSTLCTQGVGGSYSHTYNSTFYDVDFDTPNHQDDYVFAPVSGLAYVHDDPNASFGRHINIDLGDGTYIVLAHLEAIFVNDTEEVAAGQLLGFEGTTGASSGDHVHIGRHSGDASREATQGASVEGLAFQTFAASQVLVSDMICGLSSGDTYISVMETPLWHPSGTLVKTPESPDVYVLDGNTAYPFFNETSFWSRNYDFADLAMITQAELACYEHGPVISGTDEIRAVYDGSNVWMLFRPESSQSKYRQRVRSGSMISVLDSWGIHVPDTGGLQTDAQLGGVLSRYPVQSGFVKFRDGTLVRENGSPAVYAISSGVAMPVFDWDAYLLLDFFTRYIVKVEQGEIALVQGAVGNCTTGAACIQASDVLTCGGDGEVVIDDPVDDTGDTGLFDTDTDTDTDIDTDTDTDTDTDSDTDVDTDTDTDSDTDTEAPFVCEESSILEVTWTTSSLVEALSLTMSGEYTRYGGSSAGWIWNMITVCNQDYIMYQRQDAKSGDVFEFFVEYTDDTGSHEFCNYTELAPLNGPVNVTYGGMNVNREVIPDPFSSVCTVRFTIP